MNVISTTVAALDRQSVSTRPAVISVYVSLDSLATALTAPVAILHFIHRNGGGGVVIGIFGHWKAVTAILSLTLT